MPFRNQVELDRSVASATGEDLRTIRRRGFSLVEPAINHFDLEPDLLPPQIVDWDALEESRVEPVILRAAQAYRKVA